VFPVLLILFVVVPIAELALIIAVGREIGVGPTVLVLLADAILGSLLARSQGRLAWRRFSEATRAGRPPAKEVIDGALVLFGGALLLTPGFLTDVFGILLLLPPTRAVARRVLVKRLAHRMVVSMTAPRQAPRGRGAARPGDVDGTAEDVEVQRRELP
jgi:UPF0716 protein FxsA